MSCAIFLAAILAAPAYADTAKPGSPAEVATRFLRSLEKKDFQTLRTLFAPGAVASTVNLSRSGPPALAHATGEEWVQGIEKEFAGVDTIKIEILDVETLDFDQGATVSIRFRATGTAGAKSFTNDGVDTYAMVSVDGAWKIVQYSYIELLEFR
jgi:hypothetical protein